MKYANPKLHHTRFNMSYSTCASGSLAQTGNDCGSGSQVVGDCSTGGSVNLGDCQTGTAANSWCFGGTAPGGSVCSSGTGQGLGNCQTGGAPS